MADRIERKEIFGLYTLGRPNKIPGREQEGDKLLNCSNVRDPVFIKSFRKQRSLFSRFMVVLIGSSKSGANLVEPFKISSIFLR